MLEESELTKKNLIEMNNDLNKFLEEKGKQDQ